MGRYLDKEHFLQSPKKDESIKKAKKAVLRMMDDDNKRIFLGFSEKQQEDFILEVAFEDEIIKFEE